MCILLYALCCVISSVLSVLVVICFLLKLLPYHYHFDYFLVPLRII